MKRGLALAVVLLAALAEGAGAATTRYDEHGTTLVDGRKIFPIVLAKGPEPESTTPGGADALDEVVDAGVNFFKVGPASDPWPAGEIAAAKTWNSAAAARGVYTWINLATLSDATPDTPVKDARLRQVIAELEADAGGGAIGMWKGADEPWLAGFEPEELQYAYCVATSRGEESWCGGRPTADSDHLWVTIQAPRGTASELEPYSPVTDVHGVDHYPVTFSNPDPDLHEVGTWTKTVASITPKQAVWTTLQVCASGSSSPDQSQFVLPSRQQERYMIYDAILNGARSLAFYGGNLPRCWNQTDTQYGWSWTFWDTVLEGLIREINADSPIAPALVNPGSTKTLAASDATTQVISRQGAGEDLWVIAARSGPGAEAVTISGLPASMTGGTVYTEGRSVDVNGGSFTDTFERWGVHVYRFAPPPAPTPTAPTPPPPPPPAAPPPPPAPAATAVPRRVLPRVTICGRGRTTRVVRSLLRKHLRNGYRVCRAPARR